MKCGGFPANIRHWHILHFSARPTWSLECRYLLSYLAGGARWRAWWTSIPFLVLAVALSHGSMNNRAAISSTPHPTGWLHSVPCVGPDQIEKTGLFRPTILVLVDSKRANFTRGVKWTKLIVVQRYFTKKVQKRILKNYLILFEKRYGN